MKCTKGREPQELNEKTASQHESFHKWKEHFKNLLRNPPETTDKLIQKSLRAN